MRFFLVMAKKSDEFGKFVRLNLIGEIVEVVSADSKEITVKYYGHQLTMRHSEVSRITPEEAASAASQIDESKSEKLTRAANERVYIFQNGKNGAAGPNFK
jgi:hypothetical protein